MSFFVSVNPSTGEALNEYAFEAKESVDLKLLQSEQAFKTWSQLSFNKRSDSVLAFTSALRNSRDSLAKQISLEMGKPLKEALAEVDKGAESCEVLVQNYIQWKALREYQVGRFHVRLVPMGPLLGIMPWNFPVWQVLRFAIPALLGGNVVLIKHAPNTFGSAQFLDLLFQKFFPLGVYTNLQIPVESVKALILNEKIKAISLTGSKAAGQAVGELAGRVLKKVVLELGGSDAYVVLKDADLNLAARVCVKSRLVNGGQSCVAAKRFIVEAAVYDEFRDLFLTELSQYKVGDPFSQSTRVGPLARKDLLEHLASQVAESLKQGAKISDQSAIHGHSSGFFYPVTLLENVKPGQVAFDEELFGPVACLIKANDEAEALSLANNSEYGLGGAVFTSDLDKAFRLALNNVEAGMVFVNDLVRSDALVPFGGIKNSGLGRELGREGVFEFMHTKTIFS